MRFLETNSGEIIAGGSAADVAEAARRLSDWAVEAAFPLWASSGFDRDRGFEEKLGADGRAVASPRRARVQPRQVFAFSHGPAFGWTGPVEDLVRQGSASMLARYRRPDGLFRTLVDADGTVLDDQALLYDQAFVLLALAGAREIVEDAHLRAVALREAIIRRLGHRSGGFLSGDAAPLPLLANPHMHLFEACLAWMEAGGDDGWGEIADRIAGLALTRMIDGRTGALFEAFTEDWSRVDGLAGRIVEPGHQFEWAWLLLRWSLIRGDDGAREAALRLVGIGERFGIDGSRGVAVLELLDDMSAHAPVGRLWAQTERIKAGCLAASVTGETRYLDGAAAGCRSVLAFLDAASRPGLWRDQMRADGSFVDEATPASTFYHLIVAIDVLRRQVLRLQSAAA